MTHLPKNKWCLACMKGKMTLTPNQHKTGLSDDEKLEFGGRITADDLFADKMESRGFDGSKYATVTLDHGTDWADVYPVANLNTIEAIKALQHFAGPTAEVSSFYTDGGSNLSAAATEQGWCHDTSTPHVSQTNGKVERRIRTVEEGTRTVLADGGFDPKWWPLAAKHFVFAKNIRRTVDANYVEHPSPWEKRHKAGRFKGKEVPFGAAINFLPPKPLRKKSPKFGTSALPGIFLGYHLSPGGRWRGEYLVSSIDSFR